MRDIRWGIGKAQMGFRWGLGSGSRFNGGSGEAQVRCRFQMRSALRIR
ncbi:hypothetical protein Hamer_G004463 [Homarus americanus]|uniref:Uncharacterized protein n=1 Tax=Homarus americanus TaxID=6706 RepID=A0A8J5JS47_HOMAM|nr:hypothetical protein Hamer_G004463 [Homarus americanus]